LISILVAAALGILLAVILAQRIGRPLASLAKAAAALSNGDLSDPPPMEMGISEVALVSQALASSRASLQQTLDELRREKAWTDHLLSAIVEGIVTLDRQGRITFFSPGAERITGWSQEQVMGRNCDQVFITAGGGQPFSSCIPSPGGRSKIPIELPDGRQLILSVTGARLLPPEGGDARVVLVFRDISEEEVVHRLLSHFLANVTHEFRTPLSAVAASVELLRDQAADLQPEELQELLDSLHVGVLNLQKLVDNLLETASIEAGRFQVHARRTDLGEIIAEATRTIQPLLDKHGQRLLVELPTPIPTVRADPRRTVQVLVNLLSNASKYGPDNAQITLAAALQDGWVRLVVTDQGPGIPEAHRRDLFRRFMIPHGESQDAQVGFGLGLSVVKAIVEAHGGHVGVEDAPAGGSTFWFTLPMAAEPVHVRP
jgi:PAS domain S-box-containing protein